MLPVIVLIGILAIVALVIATVVTWLLGLLTAILFGVVTLLFLYAFHEFDMIDIEQDRWLLATPFIMFFVGLGLDKAGVLTIQPLSIDAFMSNPFTISLTNILLFIVVALLIVNVVVARRE
jgi:predicted outer membrane lipoprotein